MGSEIQDTHLGSTAKEKPIKGQIQEMNAFYLSFEARNNVKKHGLYLKKHMLTCWWGPFDPKHFFQPIKRK